MGRLVQGQNNAWKKLTQRMVSMSSGKFPDASVLRERYGSETVLIHKDDGEIVLPDAYRLAASLRTCGDPDCYFPQHLTDQASQIFTLIQSSLAEWLADGCPGV